MNCTLYFHLFHSSSLFFFFLVLYQLIIKFIDIYLNYLFYYREEFFFSDFFFLLYFQDFNNNFSSVHLISPKINQYLWITTIKHLFNKKWCNWTRKISSGVSFLLSFPKNLEWLSTKFTKIILKNSTQKNYLEYISISTSETSKSLFWEEKKVRAMVSFLFGRTDLSKHSRNIRCSLTTPHLNADWGIPQLRSLEWFLIPKTLVFFLSYDRNLWHNKRSKSRTLQDVLGSARTGLISQGAGRGHSQERQTRADNGTFHTILISHPVYVGSELWCSWPGGRFHPGGELLRCVQQLYTLFH